MLLERGDITEIDVVGAVDSINKSADALKPIKSVTGVAKRNLVDKRQKVDENVDGIGKRVTGPPMETPVASLNPKPITSYKGKKSSEKLTEEQQAERKRLRFELAEMGIKTQHNTRLDTLQAKMVKAKKDLVDVSKQTAAVVWDGDPDELMELPFEQLLAVYKTRSTEFNKPVENFTDKESLITKMSSEFVKK